jgi:hypothetical protein
MGSAATMIGTAAAARRAAMRRLGRWPGMWSAAAMRSAAITAVVMARLRQRGQDEKGRYRG